MRISKQSLFDELCAAKRKLAEVKGITYVAPDSKFWMRQRAEDIREKIAAYAHVTQGIQAGTIVAKSATEKQMAFIVALASRPGYSAALALTKVSLNMDQASSVINFLKNEWIPTRKGVTLPTFMQEFIDKF